MNLHSTKFHMERPGLFLTGIAFAALTALLLVLMHSQMIPSAYMALYAAAALLLVGGVFVLTKARTKRVKFAFGTVITVLVLIFCSIGCFYIVRTVHMLRAVSDISTRRSTTYFYVSVDDPAQSLRDAADLTFGILAENDRQNTDAVLAQVAEKDGLEIKTKEYDSLIDLADGFHNVEIGGILLNSAYMDLYQDTPGYETFASELKIISMQTVERVVAAKSADGEEPATEEPTADRVINVLISGSDTRSSIIDERGRSDVNIIVSANLDTHELLMLSTPRDYFVALDIPKENAYDKLTHAGVYGMDVLTGTLGNLYGIDIDYFFRLNFTGFVEIVDALGGVDVESDYTFDSGDYHYVKGTNHLDGQAALDFAHNRYAFASGDRQRGNNQMAVLRAALDKAMSPVILSSYLSILDSVQNCIYTNIPYDLVADIVSKQLEDPEEWKISSFSVDGSNATSTTYSINRPLYVMIPNLVTIQQAQQKLENLGNDVRESTGAYGT